MRRTFRWTVAFLLLSAVLACGGHRPPIALVVGSALETRLGAYQDAERKTCDPALPPRVTTCVLASSQVGLTTERHNTLARELVVAFTAQADLARAIRAGQPTEPILSRVLTAVRAIGVTGTPITRTPYTADYWVALEALLKAAAEIAGGGR